MGAAVMYWDHTGVGFRSKPMKKLAFID